jgi:hypothetical protein
MLDAPTEVESQTETPPVGTVDTPEPSQEQATVTVENGRRRGRRRVLKKKKVKDEDGYLGKHILTSPLRQAKQTQSPKKRLSGSLSRKRNRNPRSLNLHHRSHLAAPRENLPQRKGRAALPASLKRLKIKPFGPSELPSHMVC